MKRVVVRQFGGVENLTLEHEPDPVPASGQVLVQLSSIGMNHAELMARRGEYRITSGQPPFTPGLEGGGVIVQVGAGVADRAVGQRVVLTLDAPRIKAHEKSQNGSYRTHFLCEAAQTLPAPDNLPDEQLGALWLAYLTAWGALVWKHGGIRPGSVVALPAASSSVALAASQIVRHLGGVTIGLTTRSHKADLLGQLPTAHYDHLLVTHDQTGMTPWHQRIKELTGGRGVDVFLDPVANGPYLDAELRCLADAGTIYLYGLLGRGGEVDMSTLIRKRGAIRGWVLWELNEAGRDAVDPGYRHILDGFARGVYRQHLGGVFPLQEVQRAHATMERGEHIGKLVLVP